MEAAPSLVAVELRVIELVDHLADGRTQMLSSAGWRWLDRKSAESAPQVLAELERLAARAP